MGSLAIILWRVGNHNLFLCIELFLLVGDNITLKRSKWAIVEIFELFYVERNPLNQQ